MSPPFLILQLVGSIIGALLYAGFFKMSLNWIRGEGASWKDSFYFLRGKGPTLELIKYGLLGWGYYLISSFLVFRFPEISILSTVSGLFLMMFYCLAMTLVFDRGLKFWPAAVSSFKYILKNLITVGLLVLMLGVVYFLSVIPLGIGLIWTLPAYLLGMILVYEGAFGQGIGEKEAPEPDELVKVKKPEEDSAIDKLIFE